MCGLVSKAKLRYYRSKTENVRRADQGKWYKVIYKLAAAEEPRGALPTPETGSRRYLREIINSLFQTVGGYRSKRSTRN